MCLKLAMDIISAVKELHKLSSQELNKLVKDSESFIINLQRENGSETKVDLEKFAGFLPLHLVAVIVSSDRDEPLLKYLLSGIRLLHSLCDLAHRHAKLEQILLDDVKISEQLLDLVFYVLIIMSGYREENNNASSVSIVHSALVACSLHLLTGCISSQWQDLVQVLLAHPKVDIFMDVAFGAVHVAFRFLEVELATEMIINPAFEQLVIYLCHQCEASLQFLHSLCQQKAFRERLVKNKELCRNGGVLFLVQAILKLNISPPFQNSSSVVAAVSRLKAKVLSILLLLCEAESLSYLDEVASCPESFDLAKSIALEVLELLKAAIGNDQKHHSACNDKNSPTGLLQLNAMRLADIFSDDSNFRNYITTCFTKVLTAIFSLPYIDFLSIWCSSELPQKEEDASLEFDPFVAAGRVLDTSSVNQNAVNVGITLVPSRMPRNTYAHQRTALFVKIIANLHCFVPNVCEEQERNLFLLKFLECLRMEPSESLPGFSYASASHRAATVSKNLRSLLSHAESLIPNSLNEEDVQLLRVFFNQLMSSISPTDFGDNQSQEVKVEKSTTMDKFSEMTINEHLQDEQSTRNCLSPFPTKGSPNLNKRNGIQKEGMSENYTFLEDEQVNFRNRLRNLDGDVAREEKDKSCGTGSSVLRESDKDVQNNAETSCSDTGSTRGRNVGQKGNSNLPKLNEQTKETGRQVQGDDKIETVQSEEKQTRKRKRTIMNDYQIAIIEKALLDEPEMQRNAAALHSWSEKLSRLGSEISPAQLKNWLNNRKARLARAGKDTRVAVDADGPPEKQAGPAPRSALDSPGSPAEEDLPLSSRLRYGKARTESDVRTPTGNRNASPEKQSGPVPNIAEDDALISSRPQRSSKMRPEADITICEKESQESGSPTINDVSINAPVLSKGESSEPAPMSSTEPVRCKQGQSVVLLDAKRVEIGKGKVHQSQGKWCGKSLEESKTCVVDITDLKTERSGKLPYPSDVTGSSFSEAEAKFGAVRVMWDCDKVYMWRQ